jgi:cytochrome c
MRRGAFQARSLLALSVLLLACAGEVLPVRAQDATPPDGRLVAARTGYLIGHGGPIKAIATELAGDRVLTGSFDYAIMVWEVTAREAQGAAPITARRLARFDEHGGAINGVAFVPGGRLALAGGDDGLLSVWDLTAARLAGRLAGHTARIVALAVSEDGRWAASASWDRTVRLWDLAALAPAGVLAGHGGPVNAVAFSADGTRVYSAGADGMLASWKREDGSFRPLVRHGWGITALTRLAGSERLLFGGLDGAAAVVDGEAGAKLLDLPAHTRPVLAVAAIAPPGLLATGGADGTIRVLAAADGALIAEYHNPYGPVWALAFLPGGAALYFGGLDDFATLWRIRPPAPLEPIASPFPRRFQVHRSGGPSSGGTLAEGELQFARKCSICHSLRPDGANRAGPTLYRIIGRKVGRLDGYPFSEALRRLDIVWTPQTLSRLFELGPEVFTPGSKMPLQRMADAHQREALIAFIAAATSEAGTPAGIDERGLSTPESPAKGEQP